MNFLSVIFENYTNGYLDNFLNIFSIISILFGIFIIISKNPIISVLYLIFLFSSVSIYLIMLGLGFIGISYLLVYVGAVSILFIFILMLINIRVSELLSDTGNNIPLAFMITISFYYPLYIMFTHNIAKIVYTNNLIFSYYNTLAKDNLYIFTNLFKNSSQVNYAASNNWDGNLAETTHITTIGNILYTNYSIWLIITSIILLLAMVGAIVITIRQVN